MPETLTPHKLLASNEYWGTTVEMPIAPSFGGLVDRSSGMFIAAPFGASKVQALYRQAMNSGFVSSPVHQGETLPLVERGSGLVRVVEDRRRLAVRRPLTSRSFPLATAGDSPEEFDELAQRMLEERFYSDGKARTHVFDEASERHAQVWRDVYYLTGSKTGSQLEGIKSGLVSEAPGDSVMNKLFGPIVVGEAYKINKSGTLAAKIVEAEVLI